MIAEETCASHALSSSKCMADGFELPLILTTQDFAPKPHGIELSLGKSARHMISFIISNVPALAPAVHFE
ncbi:MAG: hypothetical protein WCC90_00050 [Methylocella sp.]